VDASNLGSWERACDMPVKKVDTWYRKDLVALNEMFARIGVTPKSAAPLIAEHEAENASGADLSRAAAEARVKVAPGLPFTASLLSSSPL